MDDQATHTGCGAAKGTKGPKGPQYMNRRRGFGSRDLDAMFPDGAPITVVPCPSVVRPLRNDVDRDRLRTLLAAPPRADQFADLDPRDLHATQPMVTRAGVGYYLNEDTYRRSGRTYADQYDVANKYPVVHLHGDDLVVLSGHHRAAAALLVGEPLRARLVHLDWADGGQAAMVVTPSLIVGGERPALSHYACRDRWAAEALVNMGATAWLTDDTDHAIRHLLRELAAGEDWLAHQLRYARIGRSRTTRAT